MKRLMIIFLLFFLIGCFDSGQSPVDTCETCQEPSGQVYAKVIIPSGPLVHRLMCYNWDDREVHRFNHSFFEYLDTDIEIRHKEGMIYRIEYYNIRFWKNINEYWLGKNEEIAEFLAKEENENARRVSCEARLIDWDLGIKAEIWDEGHTEEFQIYDREEFEILCEYCPDCFGEEYLDHWECYFMDGGATVDRYQLTERFESLTISGIMER